MRQRDRDNTTMRQRGKESNCVRKPIKVAKYVHIYIKSRDDGQREASRKVGKNNLCLAYPHIVWHCHERNEACPIGVSSMHLILSSRTPSFHGTFPDNTEHACTYFQITLSPNYTKHAKAYSQIKKSTNKTKHAWACSPIISHCIQKGLHS